MTTTDTHTFKVGDRVSYRPTGERATIWQPSVEHAREDNRGGLLLRFDRENERDRWKGDYMQGYRMWFATADELTPLNEPAAAPKTDAEPSAGIDSASALTAQVQALKAQIAAMQDDLATIGEHLKRTAERHEWCGEYEGHLSRLVADLSEHSAKTLHDAAKRVQTYTVSRTLTYTIDACDAAQAERIATDRYGYTDWTVEEAE